MSDANDVPGLWLRFDELVAKLMSDTPDRQSLPPVRVQEYRRPGLFRSRATGPTHTAWVLWQDVYDPDSRSQPSVYYLLANGRLARGSRPDAVDLLPGGLSDHFLSAILRRSVGAVEGILARLVEDRRARLDDAAAGPRIVWRSQLTIDESSADLIDVADLLGDRVAVGLENAGYGVPKTFRIDVLDVSTGEKLGELGPTEFGVVPTGTSLGGLSCNDRNLYVLLNSGGLSDLLAFDAGSLTIHWQEQVSDRSFDTVTSDGSDVLLEAGHGATLHCLDSDRGAFKWQWQGGTVSKSYEFFDSERGEYRTSMGIFRAISRPVLHSDSVLFNHAADGCYRLDRATGAVVWQTARRATAEFSPVVARELVLVPDESGNLLALRWESGQVAWRRYVGYPWVSSAEVVHDVVYVASAKLLHGGREASLTALDLGSGRILWQTDVELQHLEPPRSVGGQLFLLGQLRSPSNGQLLMDLRKMSVSVARRLRDGVLLRYGSDVIFVR